MPSFAPEPDVVEVPADQEGRIEAGGVERPGEHRRRRRLAVGPGDGDPPSGVEDPAEELGARERPRPRARARPRPRGCWRGRRSSTITWSAPAAVSDACGPDADGDTELAQALHGPRRLQVGSGHLVAERQEQLGERRHADAADAHEMDALAGQRTPELGVHDCKRRGARAHDVEQAGRRTSYAETIDVGEALGCVRTSEPSAAPARHRVARTRVGEQPRRSRSPARSAESRIGLQDDDRSAGTLEHARVRCLIAARERRKRDEDRRESRDRELGDDRRTRPRHGDIGREVCVLDRVEESEDSHAHIRCFPCATHAFVLARTRTGEGPAHQTAAASDGISSFSGPDPRLPPRTSNVGMSGSRPSRVRASRRAVARAVVVEVRETRRSTTAPGCRRARCAHVRCVPRTAVRARGRRAHRSGICCASERCAFCSCRTSGRRDRPAASGDRYRREAAHAEHDVRARSSSATAQLAASPTRSTRSRAIPRGVISSTRTDGGRRTGKLWNTNPASGTTRASSRSPPANST